MKHLFLDYYLDRHDKYNYAIYERKIHQITAEERFKPISYYTNLGEIIRGVKKLYVREKLMHSIENNKLDKLLEDLQEIHKELERYEVKL